MLLAVVVTGCRETELIYAFRVSPDGKNVAFVRGGTLYISELTDNGKTIVVEKNRVSPDGLSWSPDSKRLAFCVNRRGNADIVEYELDTGHTRTLIDHITKDTAPVYDHTGAIIIFRSYRGLKPDLYSFDIDSRTLKRLTADEACESAVSPHPANDLAAYVSMNFKSSRVFVIDTRTGARTELTGPWRSPRHVEFSPDGSRLLVETPDAIFVCSGPWTDPGGRLTKPAQVAARGRWARWHTDGDSILYSAEGSIWRKSLSGGAPKAVGSTGTIKILPSAVPGERGVIYVTDETVHRESFRAMLLAWRKGGGRTRWFLPRKDDRKMLERASRAAACDGDLPEAARLLETAERTSKIDGEKNKFAFKRARIEERLGRFKEAADLYRSLGMWTESARVALVYLKDFNAAKADMGKATTADRAKRILFVVAVESEDDAWLGALSSAMRHEAEGEVKKSETAYANLAASANSAEAKAFSLFLLARLRLHKKGYAQGALEAAQSALELVTDENARGLLELIRGEALRRLGRSSEAVGAFTAALRSCSNPQKRLAAFERAVRTAVAVGRFDLVEKTVRAASSCKLGDAAALGRALGELTAALDGAARHDLANSLGFKLIDSWRLPPLQSAQMLRWSDPALKALLIDCRILQVPKWLQRRILKILQADPLYTPLVELLQKVFSKDSPVRAEILRAMITGAVAKLKEKGIRGNALDFTSHYVLANLYLDRLDMDGCLKEIAAMSERATMLPDYSREALGLATELKKHPDPARRRLLRAYYAMQKRFGLGIWKGVREYLDVLEARNLQGALQSDAGFAVSARRRIREDALRRYLDEAPPAWLEDNARYWLLASRFEGLKEKAAMWMNYTADPAWLGPREEIFVKAWAETTEFLSVYPTSEMFGAVYLNLVEWLTQERNNMMALEFSRKLLEQIDPSLVPGAGAKRKAAKAAGALDLFVKTDVHSQSVVIARTADLFRDVLRDYRRALRLYLAVHRRFGDTRVWGYCTWCAAKCHEKLARGLIGNVDAAKNREAVAHLTKAAELLSKLDGEKANFLRRGELPAFRARLNLALGKAGKSEAARKADELYVRLFEQYGEDEGIANVELLARIMDHLGDDALVKIARLCESRKQLTEENFRAFDRWQKLRLQRLGIVPRD